MVAQHVSYESYGCAFASFMQHFLVGQLSTLEPCHHGPLEVGVVPKSHHRGQTCTDAYCFGCYKKLYIHCKLQTPPFPSQKKILSSSDPQKLTFYLTYITSDMRGLHFSPKRTSRMFSMITSWESLLACGRWSRTSSPFLTCLTPGLRPWKWFLETAQSGIVKINLKLWVKKEANGLALNIINFICQNLPTHQIWYYKQSWIVRYIFIYIYIYHYKQSWIVRDINS